MFKKILILCTFMANTWTMERPLARTNNPDSLVNLCAQAAINVLLNADYTPIKDLADKLDETRLRLLVLAIHARYCLLTQYECQILQGHTSWINSVTFSPDGRYALTGSSDTARLWDITQPQPTCQILQGHTKSILSVAFSPDGRYALTGSSDNTARLWDITQPQPTCQTLQGHTSWINSVTFSPDGRYALTASSDNTARLWDITQPQPTYRIPQGHTKLIYSVAFSPDARYVLTGSADHTARLWDVTQPQPTCQILQGHTDSITRVAFSPDGGYALTGSSDKTARLWNIKATQMKLAPIHLLLLLKLKENPEFCRHDIQAMTHLQKLAKDLAQTNPTAANEILSLINSKNP